MTELDPWKDHSASVLKPDRSVVIIGRSSSQCSVCHGNANPWEWSHVSGGPGSGYAEGSDLGSKNGCGVKWEDKISTYYGMDISRFKVPYNEQLEIDLGVDNESADDVK